MSAAAHSAFIPGVQPCSERQAMADKYDELKKTYEAAKAIIEACYIEIKASERVVAQTAGVIQEGTKEIGLRVQKLKDQGAKGTELKDFMGDAEVKKMAASIEQFFGSLDKALQKVSATHKSAKTKGISVFKTARKDLEDEVKTRKKAISTKLGTGNKSLPDLEKLLATMNKYLDDASFMGVDIFVPEMIEQHRKEFAQAVKNEIAKSKDLKLSNEQQMLDEQALNERNLSKNIGLAKTALTTAQSAQQAAKAALAKKDSGTLKKQQEIVTKSLKQVQDIESIFTRAFKDEWIRSKIAASSIKGKIEATSKAATQVRQAIEVIDLQVKAMDL